MNHIAEEKCHIRRRGHRTDALHRPPQPLLRLEHAQVVQRIALRAQGILRAYLCVAGGQQGVRQSSSGEAAFVALPLWTTVATPAASTATALCSSPAAPAAGDSYGARPHHMRVAQQSHSDHVGNSGKSAGPRCKCQGQQDSREARHSKNAPEDGARHSTPPKCQGCHSRQLLSVQWCSHCSPVASCHARRRVNCCFFLSNFAIVC